jgi:predicted CXXCH cytochrome family protein
MSPTTLLGRWAAWTRLLVVGAALVFLCPASGSAKLEEGQKALEFEARDFLSDKEINLGKHLGKQVILLDFGSIYCSSCMVTVPNLIKLRKRYSEDDLAIFNIYLDIYNPQRVIKFFRGFAKDINLGLAIDDKLAISREYGIDTLPTTIIIDRGGTIRRRIVGYTEADEKEIDEIIENLMSEQSVTGVAGVKEEGAINIFVPDSFTKTSQTEIFVVGSISGEGSKDVAIRLNNLPEKMVRSKDNVFHFRTPLSLAMNLLEVKGQVTEGKVKSQSAVLFRETAMRADIRSELPAYRFHRDEENRPCKSCHKLDVPLKDKSVIQQSETCNSCHKDMTTDVFTHGPITVGGCLPCHDYQSFPNKYEIRSSGPDLCYTCHEKVKEIIRDASFIHGPTAAGMCIVCHDPHGSGERFFLRKRTDRLCISCHQDILREYSKNTIHQPVEDGECTACHNPHAAGNKKLLIVPKEELCDICHVLGGSSHMHQTGVGPKTKFPEGTPLNQAGETTCYTCHLFHASTLQKLQRGETEDFCGIGCHTVEEEEEE